MTSSSPNGTPPMVAVIGRKNSGKTTLVVRLSAELYRRGHRVMTIKHGSHTFNIDPAGTDTYRHYHEGQAERVAMVAPDKFALIVRWTQELEAETIAARYLADADVVLCEGFKKSRIPKIEIVRRAVHGTALFEEEGATGGRFVAVVTDTSGLAAPAPVLLLEDESWLEELATLVERDIMGRRRPTDDRE